MSDAEEAVDFIAVIKGQTRRDAQKLAGRRVAEKKKMAADDRRRLQRTGRTKQLGHRVRPEMLDEINAYSKRHGILPVEAIERAWQLLIDTERAGK